MIILWLQLFCFCSVEVRMMAREYTDFILLLWQYHKLSSLINPSFLSSNSEYQKFNPDITRLRSKSISYFFLKALGENLSSWLFQFLTIAHILWLMALFLGLQSQQFWQFLFLLLCLCFSLLLPTHILRILVIMLCPPR